MESSACSLGVCIRLVKWGNSPGYSSIEVFTHGITWSVVPRCCAFTRQRFSKLRVKLFEHAACAHRTDLIPWPPGVWLQEWVTSSLLKKEKLCAYELKIQTPGRQWFSKSASRELHNVVCTPLLWKRWCKEAWNDTRGQKEHDLRSNCRIWMPPPPALKMSWVAVISSILFPMKFAFFFWDFPFHVVWKTDEIFLREFCTRATWFSSGWRGHRELMQWRSWKLDFNAPHVFVILSQFPLFYIGSTALRLLPVCCDALFQPPFFLFRSFISVLKVNQSKHSDCTVRRHSN